MSVHDYLQQVYDGVDAFGTKCTMEQALCYSVEHVASAILPSQVLSFDQATNLIDEIASDVDIDPPTVLRLRSDSRWAGTASHEAHCISLKGTTTRLTVCHEMAHILAGFGHDEWWRTKFVALVRRYVSVQHASLLHSLYNRSGLLTEWEL